MRSLLKKNKVLLIIDFSNHNPILQELLQEKDHHFQLIEQNIKLKEMEVEIQGFEEEAKKKVEFLNAKRSEMEQLNAIKLKIEEEKNKATILKEKTRICLDNLDKENDDLKLKASSVEETYVESLINHEIQQGILHDLEMYLFFTIYTKINIKSLAM